LCRNDQAWKRPNHLINFMYAIHRDRTAAVMEPTNQSQQQRLKCIVLGSANAGKTCLLRRYVHGKFEDDIDVNKATTNRIARSTTSTLGADYYVKKTDNGSVFLQLWDTAGKERLKPQRIPNEYDNKSNYYQFLSISIKDSNAKNSNNYEHRYNNWGSAVKDGSNIPPLRRLHHNMRSENNSQQQQLGPHRRRKNNIETNKPLADALFRNIHCCMLVYDATSSTSFLHLMQWHSEWIQKLKQWEKEEIEKDQSKDTQKRRRKKVPFIVVANKIDLLREEQVSPRMLNDNHHNYRSVMGLSDYRGKGYAYEYAVEDYSTDESEKERPRPRDGRGHKRLTYSLKETTWSNDSTYLKSLQLSEDQLPANRLMIMLWCKRNRIPHVEASALSGEGVNEAMDMLVTMGVEEFKAREQEKIDQEGRRKMIQQQEKQKETSYFVYQPRYDRELDLFARYSSDDEKKCSFFSCISTFFSHFMNR